jgi:hypothetical protein
MRLKALEQVTRSQIENMNYTELHSLVTSIEEELEAERYRKILLDALEKQEAQIVTPKVVS